MDQDFPLLNSPLSSCSSSTGQREAVRPPLLSQISTTLQRCDCGFRSRKRGGGTGVGRAPSELGWTSEVECVVTAGGCVRAAQGVA
ncbi:hypothetical protein V6Z12_A12G118400 [Gossypium hirsutum]